jgi:predicted Rossmann fold nucleotide-binding protein DprA/Smf involved in DNA uptake
VASAALSEEARRVWETLRKEQDASAEDLAQATDLPAATVLAALFELEEAGLALFGEGGRYGVRRS